MLTFVGMHADHLKPIAAVVASSTPVADSIAMAQGGVKGLKTKGGQSTGGAKKNLGKTRKGKFMVPPKDKQRIAQASAHKVGLDCLHWADN